MAGIGAWAPILPEGEPPQIDTTVAHPSRIYDYWLGGKNSFAADREAAEATLAVNPHTLPGVTANRAFLAAAVRYLAEEAGIRQFLDVGTGLPAEKTANDVDPEVMAASQEQYNQRVTKTQRASRTRQTFAEYFSGLELVDPGIVTMGLWRPAPDAAVPGRPNPAYCAVARKPAAG